MDINFLERTCQKIYHTYLLLTNLLIYQYILIMVEKLEKITIKLEKEKFDNLFLGKYVKVVSRMFDDKTYFVYKGYLRGYDNYFVYLTNATFEDHNGNKIASYEAIAVSKAIISAILV